MSHRPAVELYNHTGLGLVLSSVWTGLHTDVRGRDWNELACVGFQNDVVEMSVSANQIATSRKHQFENQTWEEVALRQRMHLLRNDKNAYLSLRVVMLWTQDACVVHLSSAVFLNLPDLIDRSTSLNPEKLEVTDSGTVIACVCLYWIEIYPVGVHEDFRSDQGHSDDRLGQDL